MSKKVVLIPVYNEEPHLVGLLGRLREIYDGDVLFVDDGSHDRSAELLSGFEDSRTRVIRQPSNRGYGATLIRGFNEAINSGCDYLVTMDSDGQHRPDWIPDFFKAATEWDIVSGSRYLDQSDTRGIAPADRRKINQQVTQVINLITGFNLTDAFCGFKAYRVEALKRLELKESGYSMPLQLWIQARVFKLSVTERAVSRIYDDPNRSFGGDLDDPERRLTYYLETLNQERQRWGI
jgi:dolichol-phosphate mannosyltransferase